MEVFFRWFSQLDWGKLIEMIINALACLVCVVIHEVQNMQPGFSACGVFLNRISQANKNRSQRKGLFGGSFRLWGAGQRRLSDTVERDGEVRSQRGQHQHPCLVQHHRQVEDHVHQRRREQSREDHALPRV